LVPTLSYLTRLDKFTSSSTIIIFFAFAEAVVTSSLVGKGYTDTARKLDVISRIFFPIVFIITLLNALWW
jgi:hypothetical protein